MFDSSLSLEQDKRERQDPKQIKLQVNYSSPLTEKYSVGWFEGLIGEKPLYPENEDYWSGYSLGNREYWCSKKGVELSERF